MNIAQHNSRMPFISGTGEMISLIRQKDWDSSLLGPPEHWDPSLKTTLGILLNSKFPMFLWWGPRLVCFYNDAYRPSLGKDGKHPSILGLPAEEAWPEIWHIIKPLIDQVLYEGEATWFEDLLVPIYRNGQVEDVYWTFSYSPVQNQQGKVDGILVTCVETTDKVWMKRQLEESERKLRLIISQAPISIGIFKGKRYITEIANTKALELWDRREEEVMNRPILEAMPELVPQGYQQLLDQVYETGASFSANELPVQIKRNGQLDTVYVNFSFEALYDEYGKVEGIMAVGVDVTEQVMSHKKIEANEQKLSIIVEASELGIWELDLRTDAAYYSRKYLEILGYQEEVKLTHDQLLKHLHPADVSTRNSAFKKALETGILQYESRLLWNDGSVHWIAAKGKMFYDEANKPLKLIGTIRDVTDEKNHQQKLEQSEQRFRNLIMQSPVPKAILRGEDHIVEMANEVLLQTIWRKKAKEVIGKKIMDVFPELNNQKYAGLLDKVYRTGEKWAEKESRITLTGNNGVQSFFVDFEYAPIIEADQIVTGIKLTAVDVTEKVEARMKVEETALFNQTVLESSPDCIKVLDLNGIIRFINMNGVHILEGDSKNIFLDKNWVSLWNTETMPLAKNGIDKALQGHASQFKVQAATLKGNLKWWDITVTPITDASNKVISILATSRDISNDMKREQEITESEQKFRLLANSMPQHVWTADAQGNLNYFNQSLYDYSGLSRQVLFNDGWINVIHPDDREANMIAWVHAIETGEDYLFEHRFRKHTGEYRWHLSRAVPHRDESGDIQIWVGTSTDIQEQKIFAEELERQVAERTRELAQNNVELEKMNKELNAFAYVSSHDLQEPLRKIQTFSSRLMEKEYDALTAQGREHLQRMQNAAIRMQTLIEDLLAYSRTNTSERKFEKQLLSAIVEEVKYDLNEAIKENNATIEMHTMDSVYVIPFQFRQLIQNLVANALKFSSPDRSPHIKISSSIDIAENLKHENLKPGKFYCLIQVADNGIGFEQQYAGKIFELFQRLHGRAEYPGTGIGLAIVKKIVENHNGLITASGQPGKGASFNIYIPAE